MFHLLSHNEKKQRSAVLCCGMTVAALASDLTLTVGVGASTYAISKPTEASFARSISHFLRLAKACNKKQQRMYDILQNDCMKHVSAPVTSQ